MKLFDLLTCALIAGIVVSVFPKSSDGNAAKTGFTQKDADPEELAIGIQVEMEHTSDIAVAKQTALDHLSENPKYYTQLKAYGL